MSAEALRTHRLERIVYFKAGSFMRSITFDFTDKKRYPEFGTYSIAANKSLEVPNNERVSSILFGLYWVQGKKECPTLNSITLANNR